jgi:hypothetical protein
MAEYWLLTVWQIEAPLAEVYAAVCDPLRWPDWWPDAQQIEQQHAGAAGGVGRILHCTWRGQLPYRLSFDLCTTRMVPGVVVEGTVTGDLEGGGRCEFSQSGTVTTLRHEWRVRTTRHWMNQLAPVARPLFRRNHAQAMLRCGEGLARQLNARLLGMTSTDLGAASAPVFNQRWAGVTAGLFAGVVATAVQMLLWWLLARPVFETLLRDARLTAAIVIGQSVLPPPNTLQWGIMLVATLIHFALSIAYGLIFARWLGRLRGMPSLLAGGGFGMVVYVANLYGFTAFFPWFAVARDGITALTHLVFGLALAAGYLVLSQRQNNRGQKPGLRPLPNEMLPPPV